MHVTKWRVAALALVVTACADSAGEVPRRESAASAPRVVNVEVVTVAPESFEDQLTITGTVEAARDVTIAAEESGVVREVYAEKGNRVRAGQPLVKIDDQILRAQHDQARAEAALARETYERQRRLWEEEKIGSELTFLQAKYRAETAEANVRVLGARLDRTVVRAPLTGMLDTRAVEVGSMVGPGAAIARIIDVDTLKVSGGVPERYAGDVQRGASAVVNFETIPGRDFPGRTRFVGTAVNEHNRTFPVEIAISNTGGVLKPGMVARVRLARGAQRQAILVPREAVLRTETGYAVFTVQEQDGRKVAQMTPVITGTGTANRVVIESGLSLNDQVVVVGQHQVAHGDVVEIVSRGGAQS